MWILGIKLRPSHLQGMRFTEGAAFPGPTNLFPHNMAKAIRDSKMRSNKASILIPHILIFFLSPHLPLPPSLCSGRWSQPLWVSCLYRGPSIMELTAFKGLNVANSHVGEFGNESSSEKDWGEVIQAWLSSSLPRGFELESPVKPHTAFTTTET